MKIQIHSTDIAKTNKNQFRYANNGGMKKTATLELEVLDKLAQNK